MARFNQNRKRSSSTMRRSKFKRRRTSRFRRKAGSKRTAGYTTLNTRDTQFGFRGKKTSLRAYRSHLWNSSLFSNHWRSIQANTFSLTTPADATSSVIGGFNMYRQTSNPFWIAAGGAVPTDTSIAVSAFKGDITIRGGVYELIIANAGTGSTQDVRIKLFVITTVSNPDFAFQPVAPPIGWDPTASADFIKNIGRPHMIKEVLLNEANAYVHKGRFRIQKIDEIQYGEQGHAPIIYIQAHNVGHTTATVINIQMSHNLSFSGDAVT